MPAVGWDRSGNPVASLPPNDVKWTAHAVDGLVKNDIVLKRVGTDHVIIIRILCPPNEAGCAVLQAGDLAVETSSRRQARAPDGFGQLLRTLAG